jgi:catalase
VNTTEPSGQESPASGQFWRLAFIGGVITVLAALFAYAAGWLTPKTLTPARLVNRFEEINGVHPGFRRNHAKGVCVSGYFEGNGSATEICEAVVFKKGRTPVLGRFSLGGGLPEMADAPGAVRGLGLSFKQADGQEWRTAMINFPVFPVPTPQAFYDLLLASAPNAATGKPDPEKMRVFLAANPEAGAALGLIGGRKIASGFEDSEFYGLNAFRFDNSAGAKSWVRWSFVPLQPMVLAGTNDPGVTNKNYLFDALIAAVQTHPLQWRLVLTIAGPGDQTSDATIPWPEDRKKIEAGILTIDKIESDDQSLARDINFDPLILPQGMAPSDDPLLSARSAVYSKSFTRREAEPKIPAAISPADIKH